MIYIINKDKTIVTPIDKKMEVVESGALWAIVTGNEIIAYYLHKKDAMNDMHKIVKKMEKGFIVISHEGIVLPKIDCSGCEYMQCDKQSIRYCKLGKKIVKACPYLFPHVTKNQNEDLNSSNEKTENNNEIEENNNEN